jgi:hypothetical protein
MHFMKDDQDTAKTPFDLDLTQTEKRKLLKGLQPWTVVMLMPANSK